jgi:hypothetical protein
MKPLQTLSAEWIEAKNTELDAVEKRRLIEDEICRLLEVQQGDEGTKKVEAEPFVIKIACRINRKVDADLAQVIAAEHDMQDHLSLLFRWKPELKMSAWDGVGDNVKSVFSRAIISTPGRPSFTIIKE